MRSKTQEIEEEEAENMRGLSRTKRQKYAEEWRKADEHDMSFNEYAALRGREEGAISRQEAMNMLEHSGRSEAARQQAAQAIIGAGGAIVERVGSSPIKITDKATGSYVRIHPSGAMDIYEAQQGQAPIRTPKKPLEPSLTPAQQSVKDYYLSRSGGVGFLSGLPNKPGYSDYRQQQYKDSGYHRYTDNNRFGFLSLSGFEAAVQSQQSREKSFGFLAERVRYRTETNLPKFLPEYARREIANPFASMIEFGGSIAAAGEKTYLLGRAGLTKGISRQQAKGVLFQTAKDTPKAMLLSGKEMLKTPVTNTLMLMSGLREVKGARSSRGLTPAKGAKPVIETIRPPEIIGKKGTAGEIIWEAEKPGKYRATTKSKAGKDIIQEIEVRPDIRTYTEEGGARSIGRYDVRSSIKGRKGTTRGAVFSEQVFKPDLTGREFSRMFSETGRKKALMIDEVTGLKGRQTAEVTSKEPVFFQRPDGFEVKLGESSMRETSFDVVGLTKSGRAKKVGIGKAREMAYPLESFESRFSRTFEGGSPQSILRTSVRARETTTPKIELDFGIDSLKQKSQYKVRRDAQGRVTGGYDVIGLSEPKVSLKTQTDFFMTSKSKQAGLSPEMLQKRVVGEKPLFSMKLKGAGGFDELPGAKLKYQIREPVPEKALLPDWLFNPEKAKTRVTERVFDWETPQYAKKSGKSFSKDFGKIDLITRKVRKSQYDVLEADVFGKVERPAIPKEPSMFSRTLKSARDRYSIEAIDKRWTQDWLKSERAKNIKQSEAASFKDILIPKPRGKYRVLTAEEQFKRASKKAQIAELGRISGEQKKEGGMKGVESYYSRESAGKRPESKLLFEEQPQGKTMLDSKFLAEMQKTSIERAASGFSRLYTPPKTGNVMGFVSALGIASSFKPKKSSLGKGRGISERTGQSIFDISKTGVSDATKPMSKQIPRMDLKLIDTTKLKQVETPKNNLRKIPGTRIPLMGIPKITTPPPPPPPVFFDSGRLDFYGGGSRKKSGGPSFEGKYIESLDAILLGIKASSAPSSMLSLVTRPIVKDSGKGFKFFRTAGKGKILQGSVKEGTITWTPIKKKGKSKSFLGL